MDDWLAHHGIKGMKWGVRRYQNYDGTRIKDSSTDMSLGKRTFVRYTPKSMEPIKNGQYMSYTKYDKRMYKLDATLERIGFKNVDKFFETKIENLEPIKIRRGKAMIEDILAKDSNRKVKYAKTWLENKGFLDDTANAYERYDRAPMETSAKYRTTLGNHIHNYIYKNRKDFAKQYKNYDAVVDPEDFVYNYESPLIVTNDKKFKTVSSREVTDKEKEHIKSRFYQGKK